MEWQKQIAIILTLEVLFCLFKTHVERQLLQEIVKTAALFVYRLRFGAAAVLRQDLF